MTQVSNRSWPLGGRQCCRRLHKNLSPEFFRALSDPNRLALLAQLAGCRRPCSVGELAECCSVDMSVVSRHLAGLREAGLLEATKRGKEVYYVVRYGEVTRRLREIAAAFELCCPDDQCCEV